jgi:hypothetical protein
VDITVEVLLPPRGSPDFTLPGKRGYPMLGPVAVYPEQKITPTVGMQRTGYIHVLNVPPARYEQLRDVLMTEGGGNRRVWAVLHTRMSQADKDELAEFRQITVGWSEFRSLLRNVVANRDLTDTDVPANGDNTQVR